MTTLDFKFLNWQQKVYSDPARFKVVVAGRRCGKTRKSVVTLIIKALECRHVDAGVMYVAPTQGMARRLCWNLLMNLAQP